jgi:glycosyltransferase involved in cell wall biosynthesis
MSLHALFLTYHFPLSGEPGAFRPFMEARLMKMAGYDVTVITSGVQYMTGEDIRKGKGWVTEERIDGIRILRTWSVKKHRSSLIRRAANYISYTTLAMLAALFKTGKVDRVFAGTDPIFMAPMIFMVSAIKKAGLVLDERDLFPETAIATGIVKEGALTRLLFSMQQFFRRRAVSILTATPGIRRKLIEYGHPEEKVTLLYNGDAFVEEDLALTGDERSLREIAGAGFIAGYAGGLGIVNDVTTIIRAALRLKNIAGTAFVIVGEGEKRREYERWIREEGAQNIYFLGAQPRSKTRGLIKQMDVCLVALPAGEHFHATLTSKMFDYMAAGKPVLFCGGGDTQELLSIAGGGATVPPGDDRGLADLIVEFRDNERKRTSTGASGRKWFEENIGARQAADIIRKVMR